MRHERTNYDRFVPDIEYSRRGEAWTGDKSSVRPLGYGLGFSNYRAAFILDMTEI